MNNFAQKHCLIMAEIKEEKEDKVYSALTSCVKLDEKALISWGKTGTLLNKKYGTIENMKKDIFKLLDSILNGLSADDQRYFYVFIMYEKHIIIMTFVFVVIIVNFWRLERKMFGLLLVEGAKI